MRIARSGQWAVAAAFAVMVAGSAALGADRHAEYYYPKPATTETYKARAERLPEASRRSRIAFVTHVMNEMIRKNPYPPPYAIFAKGAEAEKLIIVGLTGDSYDSAVPHAGAACGADRGRAGDPVVQGKNGWRTTSPFSISERCSGFNC